ncbi:MAG: hypothetical protein EBS05_27035, partial [Proteobacteria bacterium]|nr:hypothetical protein [Pseudomonadota bacterium]
MKSRYLLYIDILGFSDLVNKHPEKIAPLYHIISRMRAHEHGDFQTIVFSDTVIVYNRSVPRIGYDHAYLVMFLCEFAQHLLFMLRGTGVYFRGLVTFGEFEHYRLGKAECFYGKELIDAYQREKQIKSIGLFIDSYCQRKNIVFDTTPLNEELQFVFITQNIGRLEKVSMGGFPLNPILLESMDIYNLTYEIDWLADVYQNATAHELPDVKAKFQAAWSFYRKTYPRATQALELNAFSPHFICPSSLLKIVSSCNARTMRRVHGEHGTGTTQTTAG